MKIAIIGGGWVGCHLASKLVKEHDVTIFEKSYKLFSETSYHNQNRLHLGYHYARSFKTRELCKNTFNSFLADYQFIVKDVPNNWYCIESKNSLLDFETYLQIFKDYEHTIVNSNLPDLEGCLNTQEKLIDFEAAGHFFNYELGECHYQEKISKSDLKALSKDYDFVINCTNNHLIASNKLNSFFELTVSYVYEKLKPTSFDGLTVVDGNFFSIYPYKGNLHSVTDVERTPLKRFKNTEQIIDYKEKIQSSDFLRKNSNLIENKILNYYENFLDDFKYTGYYLSTKAKVESGSDNRYPVIIPEDNIIHCFTGKIQGIYIIEDFVNKYLSLYD